MDTQLTALLGEHASDAETVIQNAPLRWRLNDAARGAVVLLAKMGVSMGDMRSALEAACRTADATDWTLEKSAEFVGTAAAVGGIRGANLVLIANLARVAAR